MPAQPFASSADDPEVHETGPDHATTEVERDILDEDTLLEDQPYAALEETPSTYGQLDDPEPEGTGSW